MQDKILIVDDNYEIISFIKPALEAEGFLVEYATTGVLAMEKVTEDLSLILLDVMLPHFSGFDICKRIRNRVSCPILFLTARGLEEERIKGFLVGGDDYIVKPFSLKELILRIEVHIRRYHAGKVKEKNSTLEFGALVIDIINRTVTINSMELEPLKKVADIEGFVETNKKDVLSINFKAQMDAEIKKHIKEKVSYWVVLSDHGILYSASEENLNKEIKLENRAYSEKVVDKNTNEEYRIIYKPIILDGKLKGGFVLKCKNKLILNIRPALDLAEKNELDSMSNLFMLIPSLLTPSIIVVLLVSFMLFKNINEPLEEMALKKIVLMIFLKSFIRERVRRMKTVIVD